MTTTEKPRRSVGKRYGKWLIGLAILIVGITPVVIWRLRTLVPSLLMVATQVVPKERFYGAEFAWLSNEEYVCFGADGRTLSRYRLSDGVSTPLLGQLDAHSKGDFVQASPNGKWLLWGKWTSAIVVYPGGTREFVEYGQGYLTRLADAHSWQESRSWLGQWEPDSRHIIVGPFVGRPNDWKIVIWDAFTNSRSYTLPVAPNVYPNGYDLIMVASGYLLETPQSYAAPFFSSENVAIEIKEYGLDATLHLTRKWFVAPPHDTSVRETKISPTGDRIAWLVDSDHVDPALAQMHRLLPFIKAPSQPRQELWISRLDGTGMRVVGQTPEKSRNGNPLLISDLRWLPDGKHLSFSYDAALWTVPAKP